MIRRIAILPLVLLVACDPQPAPPRPAVPVMEAPPAPATGSNVVDAVKALSEESAVSLQKAAAAIPEIAAAVESSFSIEKLREAASSFSADDLKALAEKISTALQDREGIVKGLEEEIARLGVGDFASVGDLKKKLDAAAGAAKDLRQKLGVVVERLKAGGLDVSKYTGLLGA